MTAIKTTINIRSDVRMTLISAAFSHGISVNEMIIRLLTHARKYADIPIAMFSRVQYQPRSDEHEWESQHVSWRVDDYEKFQDMRRLWKMAISYILAYAIEQFLELCIDEKWDNNPASYVFMSTFDHENEYFVVFWKYPPPNIMRKFRSSIPPD